MLTPSFQTEPEASRSREEHDSLALEGKLTHACVARAQWGLPLFLIFTISRPRSKCSHFHIPRISLAVLCLPKDAGNLVHIFRFVLPLRPSSARPVRRMLCVYLSLFTLSLSSFMVFNRSSLSHYSCSLSCIS